MASQPNPGRILLFAAVCAAGFLAPAARAEGIAFSVQGTTTLRFGQEEKGLALNAMNRNDNPFSVARVLFITRADVNENTEFYVELPVDLESISSLGITYLRPFVRINEIGGAEWLNVQAGKLPTLFGTYGERTSSPRKGLIGVPLLYYYHTAVRSAFPPPGPDYFFQPGVRGGGNGFAVSGGIQSYGGNPIVYDACWDIGAEVFGSAGGAQVSLATTLGTVSNPAFNGNYNDGYGVLGRIGYQVQDGALFGLRVGGSAGTGPYLDAGASASPDWPAGADVEDFLNTALGLDLAYARGPWQLFAELGRVGWEVPNVDPTLWTTSWYGELTRTLGPSWMISLRGEQVLFSDLTSTGGVTEPWDHDLNRLEAGIVWRFRPRTQLRLAYQGTRFPDAPSLDADMVALQLQVWSR